MLRFSYSFSLMKPSSSLNVQPSTFYQFLRHFVDEETVFFDIFQVDGKEDCFEYNRKSISSLKNHQPQRDHHQQNSQTYLTNNKNPLPSYNSLQDEFGCFECFQVGNHNSTSKRDHANDFGITRLKW